jgi:hypothetical protein
MKSNLKIGDSVVVKQGVKEPDLEEFEMGGWQGRITDIDTKLNKDHILITIEWDSLTLVQIPSDYIVQSEIDGFDWSGLVLYDSDLEKSVPRDKKENVKKAKDKLSDECYWASLGEQGLRISKILHGVNPHNEMKSLQKWVDHLDKELTFPIQAIVTESEDDWLIKSGDIVLIKSFTHIVDMYGIIAKIRLNGKKYEFPLCDLEVIDKTQANFQLIDDYRTWFGNK